MKRALKIIVITFTVGMAVILGIGAVAAYITSVQTSNEIQLQQQQRQHEETVKRMTKQQENEATEKEEAKVLMYECMLKAKKNSEAALNYPGIQDADPTFVSSYTQTVLLEEQNQIAICKSIGSQ